MSTTKQNNDKSATHQPSTMGVDQPVTPPRKKREGDFTKGYSVLHVRPKEKVPVPTKQYFSTKKYNDSPTRNAKKVKKNHDIDVKTARDLKFEFQGMFDALTDALNNLEGIKNIDSNKFNDALDIIASIDTDALNSVFGKVANSSKEFSALAREVRHLALRIEHSASSIKSKTSTTIFFVSVILSIGFYTHGFGNRQNRVVSNGVGTVALILAITTVPDQLGSAFISSIKSLFAPKNEFQSFAFPCSTLAKIFSMAMGVTTCMSAEKHFFAKFNETITHFDRKSASIESILKMVVSSCQTCINFALEKMGYGKVYMYDDTGNFVANEFIKDYNDVVRLCDLNEFSPNEDNFKRLISLCDRAQEILIEARKNRENDGLLKVISTIHSKLLVKKDLFVASNFKISGVRIEPVCIVLKGPPGVGKSQTVLFLQSAICAFALQGAQLEEAMKDPTKFMYNRQPENIYWDGYDVRHIVTVFDDFGQIRDVAGNPDCEYMNLIRAVNEFPAMLHTAAMEKKSNTFFRSEFVIMTTNMEHFSPESINSADALLRRFHLCYEITVKPEYATNGMIDGEKLDINEDGEIMCNPDILNFREYDFKTGHHVSGNITFYQLVDRIRDQWLVHRKRNATKRYNLDSVMSKITGRYEYQAMPMCRNRAPHIETILERSAATNMIRDDMEWLVKQGQKHYEEWGRDLIYADVFFWFTPMAYHGKHILPFHLLLMCAIWHRYIVDGGNPYRLCDRIRFVRYEQDSSIELFVWINFMALGISNFQGVAQSFLRNIENATGARIQFQSAIQMDSLTDYHSCSSGEDSSDDEELDERLVLPTSIHDDHSDEALGRVFFFYKEELAMALKVEPGSLTVPLITKLFTQSWYELWKENFIDDPNEFIRIVKSLHSRGKLITLDQIDWVNEIEKDEVLKKFHWWNSNVFKSVSASVCAIGVGFGIYKLAQHFGGDDSEPSTEEQMYSMKKDKAKGIKKQDFKALQNRLATQPQSYFGADTNGAKIIDKITSRNLYRIKMFMGVSVEPVGFGLFIRGTTMLIPQHFVMQAATFVSIDDSYADYEVRFELAVKTGKPNPSQVFSITMREFIVLTKTDLFSGRDLALLMMPRHIPMHQDIVPYFLSDLDYTRERDWSVRLVLAHEDKFENLCSKGSLFTMPLTIDGTEHLEPKVLTQGIRYNGNTTIGDCGAPLFIVNSRLPKARCLGVHVAGQTHAGIGISSIVTRDELETAFEEYPDSIEEFECEEYDVPDVLTPQSRFKALYKAPLKHNSGNKSMIAKSDMYGYGGPVKTAPAILRPVYRVVDGKRVLVDPYERALKKYCTPSINYDTVVVQTAMHCVWEMLRRKSTPFDSELFSFEKAVTGEHGDQYFNALARSTSAGYPYSSMNLGRGKFYFFGTKEEYDLNSKPALELKAKVEEILSKAGQGIRLEHIFTDNLKDERRPLAKIETVSTRLFSGAPLAYTIAFRMMFGAFMRWYISNHTRNGSAIGVNVYGLDWDLLAKEMLKFSSFADLSFGAGDYSAFDGSEKPFVHWVILDLINKFYDDGEVNKRIRIVLWYDLVNSKHIRGSDVYTWPSSLPSGHPCTTIVNNLYNHIAFNLCWIQMDLPVFGDGSFYDSVYLCTMGDDNIYAVCETYRDVFTEIAVSREMAKLGLTYTPEIKDGKDFGKGLRRLTEISFLKRKFKWDNFTSRWTAPIDIDVILDMPNWTKHNPELRNLITKDNVETALLELSLHGRETYDRYATCMLSAYKATGLPSVNYESYEANVHAIHNRLRYL